jgi:hypothetical protein
MADLEKDIELWRKSSFSQGGDCVEVAFCRPSIFVRDSKRPQGSLLTFTVAEWSAFLAGVRSAEFDKS